MVKLFTEDAAKPWTNALKTVVLPVGSSYSVELEGVDGQSGLPGSGRIGPIDVTDGDIYCLYDNASLNPVHRPFYRQNPYQS